AFELTNGWYDRAVEAVSHKSRAECLKKLDRYDADFQAMVDKVVGSGGAEEIVRNGSHSAKQRGQAVGEMLILCLSPALSKIQNAFDRDAQTRENLFVALALEKYHRENGSYPDTLEALAPKYLPNVPDDRFSGKALIYKPNENGYLLYSVGANEKDEG